jgi:PAS domain S-box-containing protein
MDIIELPVAPEAALSGGIAPSPDRPLPPAVADELARLRMIVNSALDYAIITLDLTGRVTGWNHGAERLTGYPAVEVLGGPGDLLFTAKDRAEGAFTAEMCRAMESGRAANERWHLRRDGSRFWASGLMLPLCGSDGEVEGFLNIMRDCTDSHRETERRKLILSEMNHRLKNVFATVRAVASQTGHHVVASEAFQDSFTERLMALSRSHDLLIRTNWQDAPLLDIVKGALAPYLADEERVFISGPPVLLPAELVMAMGLAFHELATNAAKYGALSGAQGRVSVTWTLHPEGPDARRVQILWREANGPVVVPPRRRGFGTELLSEGLDASARVSMRFPSKGVECRIHLPLGDRPWKLD